MLGLTSVTFRDLDYREIIKLCGANGVDAIEWGGDIHVPSGAYALAKTVGEETRANGIATFSYGSYYRAGTMEDYEGSFNKVLQTARALGCSLIRIWAGDTRNGQTALAAMDRCIPEITAICKMARQEGIRIGMEYHRGTLTESRKSALTLIKAVDAPNLYTYWQPNPQVSMEEQLQEIRTLKEYLCNIHVFYWQRKGTKDIPYPLADGIETWKRYERELRGTDIPRMIEFVKDGTKEQFVQDMDALRAIGNFSLKSAV